MSKVVPVAAVPLIDVLEADQPLPTPYLRDAVYYVPSGRKVTIDYLTFRGSHRGEHATTWREARNYFKAGCQLDGVTVRYESRRRATIPADSLRVALSYLSTVPLAIDPDAFIVTQCQDSAQPETWPPQPVVHQVESVGTETVVFADGSIETVDNCFVVPDPTRRLGDFGRRMSALCDASKRIDCFWGAARNLCVYADEVWASADQRGERCAYAGRGHVPLIEVLRGSDPLPWALARTEFRAPASNGEYTLIPPQVIPEVFSRNTRGRTEWPGWAKLRQIYRRDPHALISRPLTPYSKGRVGDLLVSEQCFEGSIVRLEDVPGTMVIHHEYNHTYRIIEDADLSDFNRSRYPDRLLIRLAGDTYWITVYSSEILVLSDQQRDLLARLTEERDIARETALAWWKEQPRLRHYVQAWNPLASPPVQLG